MFLVGTYVSFPMAGVRNLPQEKLTLFCQLNDALAQLPRKKKTVIECSLGSRPKTYYIRNRLLMSSHNLEKVDFAKHYFNKVWRSLKRSFFREWGNSTDRSDGSLNLVSFRDQRRMKTM